VKKEQLKLFVEQFKHIEMNYAVVMSLKN